MVPDRGGRHVRNALVQDGPPIPLWKDLGKALAADLAEYSSTDSLDISSAYEHEFSRVRLVERLIGLLGVDRTAPGAAHEAFCGIPFDTVCTTNFDFLLETQYAAVGRYCRPVMDEDQLSIATDQDASSKRQRHRAVTLLKLHGDVHHPQRMVITERDYDGFIARYPLISTFLSNLLISRTAVLVGYSLDDPDFRQIWNIVSNRLGSLRRPAYCIAVGENNSYVSKFARRNVQVINLPARAAKGVVLTDAFKELRDYFTQNSLAGSQAVDEDSLQQIQLPVDARSRICFFSIPLKMVALYREVIYPIAREFGFVPMSADEVVAPGDAIIPKIQALIDRAEVVIVELSGVGVSFELQYALARLGAEKVLVSRASSDSLQFIDSVAVLVHTDDLSAKDSSFISGVREWFASRAVHLEELMLNEPERLLQKGEFRAASISAISSLEVNLRKILNYPDDHRASRGLPAYLSEAVKQGRVKPEQETLVRLWQEFRHRMLHTDYIPDLEVARRIVEGVNDLLRSLRN